MIQEEKQLYENNTEIQNNQQQYIDDKFANLSLQEKLKQVLSNTQVVSVTKQQYEDIVKNKQQRIKKSRIENQHSYLLMNAKSKIGKINNKLQMLNKIMIDIQKQAQSIISSKKIQQKMFQLEKIRANSRGFKKMFIFLDDIDNEQLQKQAEERFK